MEMTLKGTPKENAAPVPELQERQNVAEEIAENKTTYLAWKEDLKRTGQTPSDAVAWCRARGFTEYADRLERFIDQMEGSEQTTEPNSTQQRLKKLESSIRLLTSFLIGHLVAELISAIFFR